MHVCIFQCYFLKSQLKSPNVDPEKSYLASTPGQVKWPWTLVRNRQWEALWGLPTFWHPFLHHPHSPTSSCPRKYLLIDSQRWLWASSWIHGHLSGWDGDRPTPRTSCGVKWDGKSKGWYDTVIQFPYHLKKSEVEWEEEREAKFSQEFVDRKDSKGFKTKMSCFLQQPRRTYTQKNWGDKRKERGRHLSLGVPPSTGREDSAEPKATLTQTLRGSDMGKEHSGCQSASQGRSLSRLPGGDGKDSIKLKQPQTWMCTVITWSTYQNTEPQIHPE